MTDVRREVHCVVAGGLPFGFIAEETVIVFQNLENLWLGYPHKFVHVDKSRLLC